MEVTVSRLGAKDRDRARALFTMMAAVFDEPNSELSDGYLDRLLASEAFWALAASREGQIVGGLTAHMLPMTRCEVSEIFIYDLAVHEAHQRQGVGRKLVQELRSAAAQIGISELFVPADDEDQHALDFYRALGAAGDPVTIFSFGRRATLEDD